MALNKGTLINRVRRMKDEIEGASESESNLVAADRREVSTKEEANENENKRGVKQMRQQVLEATSQQQHQFQHQHHHSHQHRQHAPTCLVSKLANNNEPSPRTVKQHQPHCIHHNPNCSKQQFAKGIHLNDDSPSEATMPDSKGQAVKYLKQQDKSYLLVEYRPSSSDAHLAAHSNRTFHQQRDLRANGRRRQAVYLHETSGGSGGGGNNKRTTIKFISQLYFLLHLSVILSLLMHHKNLVSNERDLTNIPQVSSSDIAERRSPFIAQHVQKHTVNDSLLHLFADPMPQQNLIPMPTTTSSVYNQLPLPLMLQMNDQWRIRSDNSLISSVVAAPNNLNRAGASDRRDGRSRLSRRQLANLSGDRWMQQPAGDILVRLVGLWHAKCALQYLLCYLLSSSVTILVCLRLFRMCTWRRFSSSTCIYAGKAHIAQTSASTDPASYGFYYRTRLDCTPVLIGSISLGLIQLIVIGLEIATNVDWLSESGWPLYLPLLQFAFVSLLMQYILGKVAKNHKRSAGTSGRKGEEKRTVLSINDGKRFNNNGEAIRSSSSKSPISNGLQNIALAHLLVTHILLWLMKLNSISLFQTIDQQRQQQVASSPSLLENMFYVNTNDDIQSTSPSSVKIAPSEGQEAPGELPTSIGVDSPELQSRAELESILRRKSQPTNFASSSHPHSTFSTTTATSTTTTIMPNDHSTSKAGLPKPSNGVQQVSVPSEIRSAIANATDHNIRQTVLPQTVAGAETPREPPTVSIKSERDLRSTDATNVRETGKSDQPTARPSGSMLEAGQQPATRQERAEAPEVNRAPMLNLDVKNISKSAAASLGKFKSSLPKRMTAFRQNKLPTKNGPVEASSGLSGSLAGVIKTRPLDEPTQAPKHRVRVLVSREEGVGGDMGTPGSVEGGSADQADDARSVGIRSKEGPKAIGGFSERPFPSVESDPPPSRVSPSVGEREASSSDTVGSSQVRLVADEPVAKTDRPANEHSVEGSDKMPTPKVTALDEEKEQQAEEEEEGEEDLDSLLPPIPNYNDTSSEMDSEQLIALPKKAPSAPARNESFAENRTKPPKDEPGLLQEDAFVFNEAASSSNATLAPPPLLVASITVIKQSPANTSRPLRAAKGPGPVFEPLVMQSSHQLRQQAQADRARQPTFADYLLPIVHQYHILIIAILFNMWLDSLRKKSTGSEIVCAGKTSVEASKRLLLARDHLRQPPTGSSSSDVGSITRSSSTRGLIAIPIRSNVGGKSRRHASQQRTEPKYVGGGGGGVNSAATASYAIERAHRHNERWTRNGADPLPRRHPRSRSMDYLHQRALLDGGSAENQSNASSLSRHNSLRSSSSERLLWIPSSQIKSAANVKPQLASYSIHSNGSTLTESSESPPRRNATTSKLCYRSPLGAANWSAGGDRSSLERPKLEVAADEVDQPNSVCSIFFGLLIVSGSLIVILLGVDLLSTLVQCVTQLVSILVCLLGLCLIWRHQVRSERARQLEAAGRRLADPAVWQPNNNSRRPTHHKAPPDGLKAARCQSADGSTSQLASHRQCFHYLFLLAAYYCGIAIALNLNRQHSMQQLFSQQVLQFAQRHLSQSTRLFFGWQSAGASPLSTPLQSSQQLAPANHLFLFHALLAIKGLLLILQVTLQTVLIRSSCQRATKELRQVYTFLMFANLSLWAMEICEQQQHLQRELSPTFDSINFDKQSRLINFDSFSRFAASIVTLSHLYHGLVFMQH